MDKIAVSFWLCFTVGLLLGQATGRFAFWLTLTGVVGMVLGLILALRAERRKRLAFHGTKRLVDRPAPPAPASQTPEIKRAA